MNARESEDSIRAMLASRAEAVQQRDVDEMMRNVADDVVTFDVVDPLRRAGIAASRERAAAWIASFDGDIRFETAETHVAADGDVAFAHMLSHVVGTQGGNEIDMWFRTTLGFRRTGGDWLIVHEHASVPFDPQTGRPSLCLKPEA